ncbi:hypothetical protein, partial [Microcystis sp.]|uniref:hypothetical protein n=1 Tax=Microcystis sp. TaxID=1127 RepID=UPI003AF7EDED
MVKLKALMYLVFTLLFRLSISRIFLNKKRRNLKKGETIDRYSFERRNQGGGKQKNGEMGSPRI